jgi:hypothetical protein
MGRHLGAERVRQGNSVGRNDGDSICPGPAFFKGHVGQLAAAEHHRYSGGMGQRSEAPVEDFTFLRPDGTVLHLSGVTARAVVLIFLRHLG